MNGSEFEYPTIVPPIEEGKLPPQGSSRLYFEIGPEYPFGIPWKVVNGLLRFTDVASDNDHRVPAFLN